MHCSTLQHNTVQYITVHNTLQKQKDKTTKAERQNNNNKKKRKHTGKELEYGTGKKDSSRNDVAHEHHVLYLLFSSSTPATTLTKTCYDNSDSQIPVVEPSSVFDNHYTKNK